MDPSLLIPSPDPIQAHWGWFQFLLILTFVLHLLFMNTMLGTAIIALVSSFRGKSQNLHTEKEISTKLPYIIAFTINMGVAPLLFIQILYGHLIYTSSVLMAVYWLSIVAILLIAYYGAYIYDFKFEVLGAARTFFIAATVILLLFIGFLFSNNLTLMLTPEKWSQYFTNPNGTILNLNEPTLIPRYLHFVVASVAVGGLFLALIGKLKKDNESKEKIKQGMKWFNYATLVQVFIGLWFLISLPKDIAALFMGEDLAAMSLLLSGIIGAFLALYFGFKNRVWPCAGTTLFTIVIMVIIRDLVRRAYLKPYFSVTTLKVEAQYSPLILFIVTLIIGLFLVAYMLNLAFRKKGEAE
jgi:hypothetical protein